MARTRSAFSFDMKPPLAPAFQQPETGVAQPGQDHLPVAGDPELAEGGAGESRRLALFEEIAVGSQVRLPVPDPVAEGDFVGRERPRIGEAAEMADPPVVERDDDAAVGAL